MIVKVSAMPTGLTLTGSFYDVSTSPETLIAAGQAFTEEGSTGVYKRDVGETLDDYDQVRVRFSNGADAWLEPAAGTVEVVSDPALLAIGDGVSIVSPILTEGPRRDGGSTIPVRYGETFTATLSLYHYPGGVKMLIDPTTLGELAVVIAPESDPTTILAMIEDGDIARTSTAISFEIGTDVSETVTPEAQSLAHPFSVRLIASNEEVGGGVVAVSYSPKYSAAP